MKRKKLKITGVVIIGLVASGFILKYISDQKYLRQFDNLIEPQISTKSDQNMLYIITYQSEMINQKNSQIDWVHT